MLLVVTECNISVCEIFNNNQLGGAIRAGLQADTGNVTVTDCHIYDDQASPTQSYGVLAADKTIGGVVKRAVVRLVGCTLLNNIISPTILTRTGVARYYQTRIGTDPMSGSFQVISGSTSIVIANDNASDASRIVLIPRDGQAAAKNAFPVSVVMGASVGVNHNAAGGNGNFNYLIM
jgi:hypothetical protein